MAVQDIQAGAGYLHGIAGIFSLMNTEVTVVDLFSDQAASTSALTSEAGKGANMQSRGWEHNWTDDEISSQDGTIIEASIITKEWREIKVGFLVKSTTRAFAVAVVTKFASIIPDEILTFSSIAPGLSMFNIAMNYQSGMTINETVEGRVMIEFTARQYKNSSGVFAALSKVSG